MAFKASGLKRPMASEHRHDPAVLRPAGESLTVCLVTVTYGDRIAMLDAVLKACAASADVTRIIVVDNGSTSDLNRLRAAYGQRLALVTLGRNQGSAGGYKAGVAAAMATGADLIWLMDDDNLPDPHALFALKARLAHLSKTRGVEKCAVLAYRPSIHLDILNGLSGEGRLKRRSSFHGFHVVQIPAKIARLAFRKRSAPAGSALNPVEIPTACYGGLLAHRNMFQMIGLPFADLILYGDDDEYTARLLRYGGVIELVPAAKVDDVDDYEQHRGRNANAFTRSLTDDSDFRVYYSFRTHSWIGRFSENNDPFVYNLNRQIFMGLLLLFALRHRRLARFRLITQAVRDGRNGILGENTRFPVPQPPQATGLALPQAAIRK
ncbi:MAG: glycosyltransferase [Sphingobium sp.]